MLYVHCLIYKRYLQLQEHSTIENLRVRGWQGGWTTTQYHLHVRCGLEPGDIVFLLGTKSTVNVVHAHSHERLK